MTRRLQKPLPDDITLPQRAAADPAASVWVKANAGSGKTHVLTTRVMRLLLAGVRPEEILCLTYTKAAAAEMRRRVGAQLADWALLPEPLLVQRLAELEGRPVAAATLVRARTLFAHALETPGGLKINTVHAFCESVLHRFPLEAGVPFDFAVIEEATAEEMVRATREAVLAEGVRGSSPVVAAVDTLFGLMSDDAIGRAIGAALDEARKLRHVLADVAAAKRCLRAQAGVGSNETHAAAAAAILAQSLLQPGDLAAAVRLGAKAFADRLAAGDPARPTVDELFGAFLTAEGEPRRKLLNATEAAANPDLLDRLLAEQARLVAAAAHLGEVALVARSEALLDVLAAISARYTAEKRRRSLLDFDDLVERLIALLRQETAAWVRYKLDAGITHILVDESQDTNPEQWHIVDALVAEFFAGDGAVGRPRTVFAVGDEKQSIYSFQGAEPRLFEETGRRYHRSADAAGKPFRRVELRASFRTLDAVLAAVDRVFAAERLAHAVLAEAEGVHHRTARAEGGGRVTLWPPLREAADDADAGNWPIAPRETLKSAPRRLAEFIAGEIGGWLDGHRALGPRGRAIRPSDILILVQRRSALFAELIRALGQRGIPTPGADRLPVTGHIAVADLLALGDVLLNPAEDLQLAALLRSPLFGVTEDELLAFAAARPPGQPLWQALGESRIASAQQAFAQLAAWRGRLDFERPYEFYAEVLYAAQGLRRFHARLGAEVDDVLAEFLALALQHEQSATPGLVGFLAAMRAREVSIRRELAEAAGGVRVMTVHGAKGLEAPIVILADAASRPDPTRRPPVYICAEPPGPLLVHAGNKQQHTATSAPLRDAAKAAEDEEYWRKLYVGMTRAEDELYLTGFLSAKGTAEETWFDAVHAALWPDTTPRFDAEGGHLPLIYPAPETAAAAADLPVATPAAPPLLTLPPLPPAVPLATVTPSTAAEARPEAALDRAAETLRDAETARRAGLALHALLQHLPSLAPADRPAVAAKAVAALLPDDSSQHAALAARALAILARPEFADLFGPNSRAEVPFALDARRDGKPVRLVGRIDRLLVAKGRILVVDYKTDATPPGDVSRVPAAYRTQVGLYAHVASQLFPGRVIEAGILWTNLESLMILPVEMLREAASAFTMR